MIGDLTFWSETCHLGLVKASFVLTILVLVEETDRFGRAQTGFDLWNKTPTRPVILVGDRSFWRHQGLVSPYDAGFCVGDRSFWPRQGRFWPVELSIIY